MKKVVFLFILAVAAVLIYRNWDLVKRYTMNLPSIEQIADKGAAVSNLNQEVNTPGPLKGILDARSAYLTVDGTIAWTNKNRADNGLPPLNENGKLSQAAMNKAQDIFQNQYFDHVSPQGAGPADLAGQVHYEFIAIGENLALGNYKDDQALVTAWMNSPGHRANILNTKYTEIGVAVLKGKYEGKTTWVAVQEFGRPASDCPAVSETLKSQVESQRKDVDSLESQLKALKAEIENSDPQTKEEYAAYNEKVREYNQLVKIYNNKIDTLRQLISQYNAAVNAFNACVGK